MFERSMLDTKRQTKTLAQVADEHLVAVRRRPSQMMIDMQHMQTLASDGGATAAVRDIQTRGARN